MVDGGRVGVIPGQTHRVVVGGGGGEVGGTLRRRGECTMGCGEEKCCDDRHQDSSSQNGECELGGVG